VVGSDQIAGVVVVVVVGTVVVVVGSDQIAGVVVVVGTVVVLVASKMGADSGIVGSCRLALPLAFVCVETPLEAIHVSDGSGFVLVSVHRAAAGAASAGRLAAPGRGSRPVAGAGSERAIGVRSATSITAPSPIGRYRTTREADRSPLAKDDHITWE
jgi:hypothetical protein